MADLKVQFSEMRKHIPKHVQWLLLIAAFIIVLILLTLLLHRDKKPSDSNLADNIVAAIKINPDSIDWTNTFVDSAQKQELIVSSNVPVKIDSVRLSKDKDGLSKPKTTCTNIGQINDKISCTITVEYKPKKSDDVSAIPLFIDWRDVNLPETMNKTEKLIIALGAKNKEELKKKQEQGTELTLAGSSLEEGSINKNQQGTTDQGPKPTDTNSHPLGGGVVAMGDQGGAEIKKNEPQGTTKLKASDCSDFAFAGYDTSGKQFGWIKPIRGSYKFHPFSDKNCDTPTGVYNPDTGIITDINDSSKRIGSDAQHIGYKSITATKIPQLSNPVAPRQINRAPQLTTEKLMSAPPAGIAKHVFSAPPVDTEMLPSSAKYGKQATVSSKPYDRTFVLRQYKPIPATIVSELRAVAGESRLPVTATVDRNVYSDNGRTIVIPSGTMMLGFVSDTDLPGPYKSIGRVNIDWYRFVRPDGVEFNFGGDIKPFSADAQGRTGVPGRGSTDYIEQFVMPMLTAIVPAAVNMIAPISDQFVNQIDLDSNTVTTSGQVKSSELAKQEIISTWNTVAQKLLVDTIDNTVPPFSIAAGTRITVFSPNDLIVTCGEDTGKKCSITKYAEEYAEAKENKFTVGVKEPETLVGQVRSFNLEQYCDGKGGVTKGQESDIQAAGLDYRTVVFYCSSSQYQSINNAKQTAVYENQKQTSLTTKDAEGNVKKMDKGTKEYNEQVLGLSYNEDGTVQNPFSNADGTAAAPEAAVLTCEDGSAPNENGCCTGETFDTGITNPDTGQPGVCCPDGGGDCFPPII